MGKTLEDGGMLVNVNGTLKVSEPTTRKFLKIRTKRIDELQAPVFKINFEDRPFYPAFFEKWVDTILFNALNMFNLNGNIAFPIYDPLAAAAKLDMDPPKLGIGEITLAILSPPGSPIPPILMGIKPEKLPDFLGKLPGIISIPDIPKIPDLPTFPPSPEPLQFSILGKQLAMNLSLPKMFEAALLDIATPSFFAEFSIDNLLEIVKKAIIAALPSPPAPDLIDYEINMYSVSEIVKDAISLTSLGVSVGSSESGLVGFTGATFEHRDPPVVEKKVTNDKMPYVNGLERTSPEFRRRLFDLSGKFGLDPEKVASVIKAETAHSFAPNIRAGEGMFGNPNRPGGIGYAQKKYSGRKTNDGSAVGLIQFTKDAVIAMNEVFGTGGKYSGTVSSVLKPGMFPITTSELGDMSATEQLDYVFAYLLSTCNGSMSQVAALNFGPKLYYAVFSPSLLQNPNIDPIYTGQLAKDQGEFLYDIVNGQYVVTNSKFKSYAAGSLTTTKFLFIKIDEQVFVNQNNELITKLVYVDDPRVGKKIYLPKSSGDTNAVSTT